MSSSIFSIVDGVDDFGYDILNPPGLAKLIVDDINKQAYRAQPRLSMLAALQIIAGVCAPNLLTPQASKTNLITMGVCLSGGGKDIGQQYMKALFGKLSIQVYSGIPSSQSISKSLLDTNGRAIYVIDEIQSLFGSMDGKSAPAYLRNIGNEMMSLYTDSIKKFNYLEIKGVKTEVEEDVKKETKKMKDEGISFGGGEYTRRMAEIMKRVDEVTSGIQNPYFAVAGYSTPQKLASIFSQENIESGLIGRMLVVIGSDERARAELKKYREKLTINTNVISGVARLKDLSLGQINFDCDETFEYAKKLNDRLEDHINDGELGSVMARAWNLIERVSTVLAAGDGGKVKIIHIKWAFITVCNSIFDLWTMHRSNASQEEDGFESRWFELRDRIIQCVRGKGFSDAIPKSKIIEKIFRSKKSRLYSVIQIAYPTDTKRGCTDVVNDCLTELLAAGVIDMNGKSFFQMNLSKADDVGPSKAFISVFSRYGKA